MKQAQRVQKDHHKMMEVLKDRVVEGKASGGLVAVSMNGSREVVAVKIQPDAVDPSDLTLLEDLVAAGINNALEKVESMIQKERKKVFGDANPPGLF